MVNDTEAKSAKPLEVADVADEGRGWADNLGGIFALPEWEHGTAGKTQGEPRALREGEGVSERSEAESGTEAGGAEHGVNPDERREAPGAGAHERDEQRAEFAAARAYRPAGAGGRARGMEEAFAGPPQGKAQDVANTERNPVRERGPEGKPGVSQQAAPGRPATERTEQGQQYVIPGAERVSKKAAAIAKASTPGYTPVAAEPQTDPKPGVFGPWSCLAEKAGNLEVGSFLEKFFGGKIQFPSSPIHESLGNFITVAPSLTSRCGRRRAGARTHKSRLVGSGCQRPVWGAFRT